MRSMACDGVKIILTSLFWLLFAATQAFAQDILNQQRLFFTHQERQARGALSTDMFTNKLVTTSPNVSPTHLDSHLQSKVRNDNAGSSKQRSFSFVFNGLLSGSNRAQAIVNGIPCRSISVSTSTIKDVRNDSRVHCPQLQPQIHSIRINWRAMQILLELNGVTIARLSVGEGI